MLMLIVMYQRIPGIMMIRNIYRESRPLRERNLCLAFYITTDKLVYALKSLSVHFVLFNVRNVVWFVVLLKFWFISLL